MSWLNVYKECQNRRNKKKKKKNKKLPSVHEYINIIVISIDCICEWLFHKKTFRPVVNCELMDDWMIWNWLQSSWQWEYWNHSFLRESNPSNPRSLIKSREWNNNSSPCMTSSYQSVLWWNNKITFTSKIMQKIQRNIALFDKIKILYTIVSNKNHGWYIALHL